MNFHHLYSKENLLGKLSKPIENQISKNNRRKIRKIFYDCNFNLQNALLFPA